MVRTFGSVTRPLSFIAHSRKIASVYGVQDYRRVKMQQEEKQDANEATPEDDEGESAISGGPPSVMEEEQEEVDLDASMENLDESEKEEQDPSPMLASRSQF